MSISAFHDSSLCSFYRISPEKKQEEICSISMNLTTALILLLIGVSFISTGLYLFLSGIGTIPALSTGIAMLGLGAGLALGGHITFFKTICI